MLSLIQRIYKACFILFSFKILVCTYIGCFLVVIVDIYLLHLLFAMTASLTNPPMARRGAGRSRDLFELWKARAGSRHCENPAGPVCPMACIVNVFGRR